MDENLLVNILPRYRSGTTQESIRDTPRSPAPGLE
jgi:hypothetical protein